VSGESRRTSGEFGIGGNIVMPRDIDRAQDLQGPYRLEASRQKGLKDASTGNAVDLKLATALIEAPAVPLDAAKLPGNWRCRSKPKERTGWRRPRFPASTIRQPTSPR